MPGRPSDNQALVLCWTIDRPRALAFVSRQIYKDHGNLSATAAALGISRRALHRWVASDKALAGVVRDARKKAAKSS
jgi:hypothetical protein